jgi:hypothetical protein
MPYLMQNFLIINFFLRKVASLKFTWNYFYVRHGLQEVTTMATVMEAGILSSYTRIWPTRESE